MAEERVTLILAKGFPLVICKVAMALDWSIKVSVGPTVDTLKVPVTAVDSGDMIVNERMTMELAEIVDDNATVILLLTILKVYELGGRIIGLELTVRLQLLGVEVLTSNLVGKTRMIKHPENSGDLVVKVTETVVEE